MMTILAFSRCFYPPVSERSLEPFFILVYGTFSDNMKLHILLIRDCMQWIPVKCSFWEPVRCDSRKRPLKLHMLGYLLFEAWLYLNCQFYDRIKDLMFLPWWTLGQVKWAFLSSLYQDVTGIRLFLMSSNSVSSFIRSINLKLIGKLPHSLWLSIFPVRHFPIHPFFNLLFK